MLGADDPYFIRYTTPVAARSARQKVQAPSTATFRSTGEGMPVAKPAALVPVADSILRIQPPQ